MGDQFPVWSLPAPVWDEYKIFHSSVASEPSAKRLNLSFYGSFVDLKACMTSSQQDEDARGAIIEKSSEYSEQKITLALSGIIYTAVFNPSDGRKNWIDLVTGFIWALREYEDVTLVLKLAYYDFKTIREMIVEEILRSTPFKCRIVALHGYLAADEYAHLICASAYIVNTSHGEGQCLPLMEFMSAGKPAIAPRHSAMEDYVDDQNAFIIESSEEWIHWPHDPRSAMRTLRYRINWESLFRVILASYEVAKNDPGRYSKMSECAMRSLENYCSMAVLRKRIRTILPTYEVYNPNRCAVAKHISRSESFAKRIGTLISGAARVWIPRFFIIYYRLKSKLRFSAFSSKLAK